MLWQSGHPDTGPRRVSRDGDRVRQRLLPVTDLHTRAPGDDGGKVPPRPADLEESREIPKSGGAFIYGSKGTIYAPGMRPSTVRLIPETKMQEVARAKALPDPWIPRVDGIVEHIQQNLLNLPNIY